MAGLRVVWADTERYVPLADAPVVVGRGNDCDVRLSDAMLSRRHLRVVREGAGWSVEDLDSASGTFVNGERLAGRRSLAPGDRIRAGATDVVFEEALPAAVVLTGDPARDARNVSLLLETVDDLYGAEDLPELLATIVDRAIKIGGGERGALLLRGAGDRLERAVGRDFEGNDLPADRVLTRTIPKRAMNAGRSIVLTDTEAPGQRAEASPSILGASLRSVLCVPLPGRKGPIGVLYVDSRRAAQDFGSADLAFFDAMAKEAALAIERASLLAERERREAEARRRLEAENSDLKAKLGAGEPVAVSEGMRSLLGFVRRIAPSEATVLLQGETGTGKEVLARYIHALSARQGGAFVVVDCGSLPEALIESELFGHEKGAFTGALAARAGRFREANGGTIFLDEVGELPLALQPKLLRVLQERVVVPLGSSAPIPVDVRVLAATHRDLERMSRDRSFREDLYYRLAVLPLRIPALRERREDVRPLAGFTREAEEAMARHPWPGNVRELEHRVHRAALLAEPPYVARRDLGLPGAPGEAGRTPDPDAPETGAPGEDSLGAPTLSDARARAVEAFERQYLEDLLRRSKGRVQRAAEAAGVTRQMLSRLLRKHGIDRARFRAPGEGAPQDDDEP